MNGSVRSTRAARLIGKSKAPTAQNRFAERLSLATHKLSDEAMTRLGVEEDHDEQRFAKRRQTQMKALIIQLNNEEALACTVRDISSTGVLLHLPIDNESVSRAGAEVRPRFTLQMPMERIEVDCEIAWRQANRLGARFTSASRFLPPAERRAPAKTKAQHGTAKDIVGKLFAR